MSDLVNQRKLYAEAYDAAAQACGVDLCFQGQWYEPNSFKLEPAGGEFIRCQLDGGAELVFLLEDLRAIRLR